MRGWLLALTQLSDVLLSVLQGTYNRDRHTAAITNSLSNSAVLIL